MGFNVSQKIFLSFLAVQIIGLVVGLNLIQQQVSIVENSADVGNALYFTGYIIVSTAVLLLILKFYKGNLLFIAIEYLAMFTAFNVLAIVFLPQKFFDLFPFSDILVPLLFVAIRHVYPQVRSYYMLAVAAVIGSLFGASLYFTVALVFAVLLSVYDLIAVFGTKHMITLAKEFSNRGAAFSISFGDKTSKKAIPEAPAKPSLRLKNSSEMKSFSYAELGLGDYVMPVMLSVSLLKESLFLAGATLLGGFIGLILLFSIFLRQRGYLPALPPIIGFSLLFFAIAKILLLLKIV